MTDYYKVLGVKARATDKEIKTAYRKLAKQYHPDEVGDDPVKARRMYAIQEAYDVLGDPKKREAYDARRQAGISGTAFGASGGAARGRGGGHGPYAGHPGAPAPDMSRFEQFFGFQPEKGTAASRDKEAGQDHNPGSGKPEGPIKPEEMFASFFGKIKR